LSKGSIRVYLFTPVLGGQPVLSFYRRKAAKTVFLIAEKGWG
jgi:hypothetical protein